MTAREVIMEGVEGYPFYDVIGNLTEEAILDCMEEYAKMKCKEVLELAAERAMVRVVTEGISSYSMVTHTYYQGGGHGEPSCPTTVRVDIGSILSLIDNNS